MKERKTMLQFLNKEMPNGLYFSNIELERIEQAANNFADQEKEAEAIEFGIWCDERLGCQLVVYSPEERKAFYRAYKKQQGGK